MAAGDVELDYDLVGASVKRLLKLHDVVDQMADSVREMRTRQTSDVWPNVQGLSKFADKYRLSISAAEADLGVLREELALAGQALAASLRSHELRDAEEQQRITALLTRLDSIPASTSAAAAPTRTSGASNTTGGM